MDHVTAILAKEVRIACSSKLLKLKLASIAEKSSTDEEDLCIPFSSKDELIKILIRLQEIEIPFGNEPAGWSPAAVFEQLRDDGYVQGKIKTVVWRNRGEPVYGEV